MFLRQVLREENTHSRVSLILSKNQPRVLVFEHSTLNLELILKIQHARGPLTVLSKVLRAFSPSIYFVSLNFTLFSSPSLLCL